MSLWTRLRSAQLLPLLLLALYTVTAPAAQLRIATVAPEGTPWLREMRAAGTAIKTGTDGRVELRFFPGGVMGNGTTVLRKIKVGQLQGGAFTGGELAEINKDAVIYGLPFLFNNRAEANAVRAKVDPLLRQRFEAAGFIAPGIAGGGFAYLFSTRPIATIEQMKGTKVWVPQGDFVSQIAFEAGGVQPIQLTIGDVYTALQTGMVETAGNTPPGSIAFQWHTKVKHMLDLPLAYIAGFLVIDKRAADKMSPEDRAVLDREIAAAFDRLDGINFGDEPGARAALTKEGIAITAPAAADRSAFEAIGVKTIERLKTEQRLSPDILEATLSALAEARAAGK
jgi:TRAP-type C4-dicarboxylate transport system substrate-binding protein